MVSTPHGQSTAQRAHRAGVDVMSLVAMSVLILAPSATAARALYADTDANATHAPWSAAYATMTHAPRDVATVISRVDDAFERCRSREFLSRALDAYANASGSDAARDAADVYTVVTDWCNNATVRMSARDATEATNSALEMRRAYGGRSASLREFLFWLSREYRACGGLDRGRTAGVFERDGDDAIEVLKEIFDESHRVIVSGKCWPDAMDASRARSMKSAAADALAQLYDELDAANVTYMDAFMREELKDSLRLIYDAYESCRVYGMYWEPPNDVDSEMFDRIRVHYTALDATLSNHLLTRPDGYSGGRRFAYLINAARDVLASRQSCAAAPAIVPGRWFVSNIFDEIFQELALDCGLMEVAADFLERYSNARGSIVLTAELDEITATLKRCDEQSNETTAMVETTINERALTELIGALETLDASMIGCGKQSQSASKRLALALRDVLDKNQGQKCFGIETAPLDSRLAQLIEPALTERGGIQIRPTRPLSIIGALFYAVVTSVMITIVAAFVWTISRCKGTRVGGSKSQMPLHARKGFTMRTASAYERHFDDIDETSETQTLTRAPQRPLGSPERPRPRPRRTSFSDFTRISRSKSLDPGAHHFA